MAMTFPGMTDHWERLEIIKRLEEMEELRPDRLYEEWVKEQDKHAPMTTEELRKWSA
jgi:hypothetical protein